MCLTYQALATFLALLPAEIIETKGSNVVIHATTGAVVWVAKGDKLCVNRPGTTTTQKVAKPAS